MAKETKEQRRRRIARQKKDVRLRLFDWRRDEMSLAEVAKRSGIPEGTLRRWQNSGMHYPGTEGVIELAREVGLSPNWLLLGLGPPSLDSIARARPEVGAELRDYLVSRLAREGSWTRAQLERWLTSSADMLDFLTDLGRDRAIWSEWAERVSGRSLEAKQLPKVTLTTAAVGGIDALLEGLGVDPSAHSDRPRRHGATWHGGGRRPGPARL